MKRRECFVSNSSSCSFTVIGKDGLEFPKLGKSVLDVPFDLEGDYEFSRSYSCSIYDVGSRVNWAFLQALYVPDDDSIDLLKKEPKLYGKDVDAYRNSFDLVRLVLKKNMGISSVRVFLNPFDDPLPTKYLSDEPLSESKRKWLESRLVPASIDHGSLWVSRPENLFIFDSEKTLTAFLFDKGSRVEMRSD